MMGRCTAERRRGKGSRDSRIGDGMKRKVQLANSMQYGIQILVNKKTKHVTSKKSHEQKVVSVV
jgi:hypothetical protein